MEDVPLTQRSCKSFRSRGTLPRVSHSADYAIRIVIDLAGRPSSRMADIAQRRKAPLPFLSKIAHNLVKAGLVRSLRGRKGGVALARPASQITVLQVIEAIDGRVALNRCVPGGGGCPLSRSCPARPLWMRLQRNLIKELRGATIEGLLEKKTA